MIEWFTSFISSLASSEVFIIVACAFIGSQIVYVFHKHYVLKALMPLSWRLLARSFLPTSFAISAYYLLSIVVIVRNLINAGLGKGVTTASMVFAAACFVFIVTTASERYEKRVKKLKGVDVYESRKQHLEA